MLGWISSRLPVRCCPIGSWFGQNLATLAQLQDVDGRFSPLLDGDGVASPGPQDNPLVSFLFQSPSRWGRCCILQIWMEERGRPRMVSVPFSMGTVLHRPSKPDRPAVLKSFSPLLDGDGVASFAAAAATGSTFFGFSP